MTNMIMDDSGVYREVVSRKEAKEQGIKRYFTGKVCKHGHVSEKFVSNYNCVGCSKESLKDWKIENKDKWLELKRNSHHKNKLKHTHKRNEYSKTYYKNNKEDICERAKNYQKENRERYNELARSYKKEHYKNDPEFKISVICRNILRRTLTATNQTKNISTAGIIGYTHLELKEYLENDFQPNMNWENFGDWHIDHIYPVSRYIKEGVECPSIINALDNLIPMWAEHNLEKSDRTLEEYLQDRPDLVELYGQFL